MDTISLTIPPKTIYLKSMRLLAASLASDMGFDIEEVEDIRVVVSEAINYKMSDRDIKINFYVKHCAINFALFLYICCRKLFFLGFVL